MPAIWGTCQRRSPRTAADLRRRRCSRSGIRLRDNPAAAASARRQTSSPTATPYRHRERLCVRAPAVVGFRRPGDAGTRRERRRRVQSHDRAARRRARVASRLVATSARDERVEVAHRLFLERPRRDRADTWRMRGSLRSPWRPRSIPLELLLWPRFETWTKLSAEPQRGVHVGRRYFANGHQVLDALCAELIHELAPYGVTHATREKTSRTRPALLPQPMTMIPRLEGEVRCRGPGLEARWRPACSSRSFDTSAAASDLVAQGQLARDSSVPSSTSSSR